MIRAVTLFLFLSFCLAMPALALNADFQTGLQYFNAKQYEQALKCLDNCVDTEPTKSDFHYWRGRCLVNLKRIKDATAEYRVAYLLASDEKSKAYCRNELIRYKQPVPATAVASVSAVSISQHKERFAADKAPVKSDKVFKLSSKKLEWDLQMNSNFTQSMKAKNADLEQLASSTKWALPEQVEARMHPQFLRRAAAVAADLHKGPTHATGGLSKAELAELSTSDIMIIIDHSGSMSTPDCPGEGSINSAQPRLRWAIEELDRFAQQIMTALPHGFTLITFDSKPDIYSVRSLSQMHSVLSELQSDGGTDLAAALKEAFRLHTAHREQTLLIAVVTDAEIDVKEAEATIVSGTHRFPLPHGVFINLMQVGVAAEGHSTDTLALLNNLHTRAGAAYNPFVSIPFSRLRQQGLGRDILAAFHSQIASQAVSARATFSAEPKVKTPAK